MSPASSAPQHASGGSGGGRLCGIALAKSEHERSIAVRGGERTAVRREGDQSERRVQRAWWSTIGRARPGRCWHSRQRTAGAWSGAGSNGGGGGAGGATGLIDAATPVEHVANGA